MQHTIDQHVSRIVYSPSPGSYAVIRMNPVEMVRHLDDPQALLEAQAMRPKSYLVYLVYELALPFPDQPWYRFEVQPIATSLRLEDKARGITPDMCIPIFPNNSHPSGREPLRPYPEGLFPYSNCYHWFEAKAVNVRVRARPEEFDETGAVKLNARSRIQMQRYWIEDGFRLPDISEDPETKHDGIDSSEVAASGLSEPTLSSSSHNPCEDTIRSESMVAARAQCPTAFDDDKSASMISSGSNTLEDKSNHSLEDIAAMGIFSGPNDDVELIPLVDLWISELADHLPQDDIPSQFEMFAEFEEVAE
ncbi:hypothetical protein ONZ51_g10139 [Trametes cubensis]|uniref:Uncharacterized protein n=1 Tax=Trametes cubensis TaxID=1111947 RepID=A0AAD7X966_9APHY|nr:hypothetical protein ONZ51_g10139 [Trametes cubensis]